MIKKIDRIEKIMLKYFREHPRYNSFVHTVIGMGIGVMITYPWVGQHPVRWGLILLGIGVIAHLYPLVGEK